MQLDIDAAQTAVFGGPGRSRRDAERVYVLKREVLELRPAVTPLAAPLRTAPPVEAGTWRGPAARMGRPALGRKRVLSWRHR
jgi:hypothetical protein